MAEKKSPCCQSSGAAGVDNDGYEETNMGDSISGDELQASNHHYVINDMPRHQHSIKEEIGLSGMNYRQLCNCEEDGLQCACKTKPPPPQHPRQTVRMENWGHCKCIWLGVFTGLACLWFVVYLTLDLAGVV